MRNERGFALVAALWLLVALSVVALGFSLRAKARRVTAGNVVESVRARAAAEAAVERVRMRLERRVDEAARLAQPAPGSAVTLDPWEDLEPAVSDSTSLAGARYRAELRDAGAALNLNLADEDELRSLFVALRVDAGHADRLAQCIMDWRDPDDLHRGRGAERDDYVRAGADVLPRNGPFQSLSELRYVQGMTPRLYATVLPYLTLLGTGQVNLNAAPAPVLAALPGMGPEAVDALLRARASGRRIGSLADLESRLSSSARQRMQADFARLQFGTTTETREVEAHADGWTEGGRIRQRITVLFVRAGSAVYEVWRQAA